jgi:photosystem II stability/assembly factor-like uncharacterized protein
VKLALRALVLVMVAAAAVTQVGAAVPAATRIAVLPYSFVQWNQHDGLIGVGRCHGVSGGIDGCVSGAVYRTSDGGRTYHVVLRTPQPIGYLQTIGANGAVATTFHNDSWRTLDGGKTWQKVASNPAVDWLNPQVGVRFSSSDSHGALAMLVTRDGGRTWTHQRGPCQKGDVAFNASADLVTQQLWWVVCEGQPGAGNEDKAIYRTRNGGKTWQAAAATVFAGNGEHEHGGISSYGYPDGLAFAPDGWGLLTESRGTLYVSRDGGTSFHAEPRVAHPEVDFAGGAAVFNGGVGFVFLGELHPRLIETHDHGRTWQVVRRWRV